MANKSVPLIDDRKPLIVDTHPLIEDKNPLIAMSFPLVVDKKPPIARVYLKISKNRKANLLRTST